MKRRKCEEEEQLINTVKVCVRGPKKVFQFECRHNILMLFVKGRIILCMHEQLSQTQNNVSHFLFFLLLGGLRPKDGEGV